MSFYYFHADAIDNDAQESDFVCVTTGPIPFVNGDTIVLKSLDRFGRFVHLCELAWGGEVKELDASSAEIIHGRSQLEAPYVGHHESSFSRDPQALIETFLAAKNSWPVFMEGEIAVQPNTDVPMPAVSNRMRVQGRAAQEDEKGEAFITGGALHLQLVLNIFQTYNSAPLDAGMRVLDWGVGCGRMGRHIPENLHSTFYGIDVDPRNIEWCQENLPFGDYRTVAPDAKTPFEDDHFNLIYSHSVLTHLSEKNQFLWLEELARICHGWLILSVHGLYSSAYFNSWIREPDILAEWLDYGFKDAGLENPDISDVTERGYYRDVAHTPRYIRNNWSRYVEVVDIIPGGFGELHDAIVCRPLK